MRLLIYIVLLFILGGCAGTETVPVQPVTIQIDTFCQRVNKERDLTWSIHDTPKSITNLRRLGAQWDASCGKTNSKPTS